MKTILLTVFLWLMAQGLGYLYGGRDGAIQGAIMGALILIVLFPFIYYLVDKEGSDA